ncbi:hydantoinase/oxoprolinase family protein [Desulfonatronospira sp.]|uniref:hydantoinase/oxoprolinase family protein n=1 Tax=Desulfonatronospira sp. TaxID=1962951 RepID=UPI0025C1D604|nr:hydantoinase/oxoprolinase family protein [Desulfonatronospira sp.]
MNTTVIGVDTGGTFTDFIYHSGGRWVVHKTLSTPDDPSRAVLEGLESIAPEFLTHRVESRFAGPPGEAFNRVKVVHGSTVATNAVLERKGVKTAIITNAGFEDVIEIGRQNRDQLYNLFYRRPQTVVPAHLRFGVPARMDASGKEVRPLDLEALSSIKIRLKELQVQSVAVCFLFSYLNPEHEQAVYRELADLQIPFSLSHCILPEFREFERLSTTVVNAYVAPKMSGYLQRIQDRLHPGPLRIMQSNGGSISAAQAMQEPVRTILSGPAGGVVGALETAKRAGFEKIITLDMGGTSTDVCLINKGLPLSTETCLSGFPLKVPMLDIHTVGAGGGSISRLDAGGALKVGPESAGSGPGPICYGRGKEITVTDAHLFLGRLQSDRFLGGGMLLDRKRLDAAFEELSGRAGIGPMDLAQGILAVADTNMERAIRVISVEKGFDPREFTLVSFGGAGGLHCAELARMLSIPRVLVPANPGVLSAMGMVLADVIKDYSRTVMLEHGKNSGGRLQELFVPLEEQARADMLKEGFEQTAVSLQKSLDMRYLGQSFEIMVPWRPGEDPGAGFEELHRQKYGYIHQGRDMEVVSLRLRAAGTPAKPALQTPAPGDEQISDKAFYAQTQVYFEGGFVSAPVLDRNELLPGNGFAGPAVITEYTSTVFVPPFARARVDSWGNIVLDILDATDKAA